MSADRLKIVSLGFEVEAEDGTVEIRYLEHCPGYSLGHIRFLESAFCPNHKFWFATDHTGLSSGGSVIASPMADKPFDHEIARSSDNTLIGLIRDGNCHVLGVYDSPPLGFVK